MNKFIILFKPRSLDDRVELDVVEAETNKKAMFKWLEENKNTLKHFIGFNNEPVSEEGVKLFTENYEQFRTNYYKSSPYFS